jgi:5'-nucleotidase
MSQKRPLILVTNDDGISAKGIRTLYESVRDFGDVVIVAPDSPQSGMGHAITIHDPLRLSPTDIYGNITALACTGTPVDCVKLAIYEVIKRKPDLLVSGINHGFNTATNVLYSGTMSAAVEGAMEGIPSIGFSLGQYDADADFSGCPDVVRSVIREVLNNGMKEGVCLNVNIPNAAEGPVKGIKVCRQAHAYWADRFESRKDQFGKTYYWLSGDFEDQEPANDTDLHWIKQGYATIVPTQFDLTSYDAIEALENWKL